MIFLFCVRISCISTFPGCSSDNSSYLRKFQSRSDALAYCSKFRLRNPDSKFQKFIIHLFSDEFPVFCHPISEL